MRTLGLRGRRARNIASHARRRLRHGGRPRGFRLRAVALREAADRRPRRALLLVEVSLVHVHWLAIGGRARRRHRHLPAAQRPGPHRGKVRVGEPPVRSGEGNRLHHRPGHSARRAERRTEQRAVGLAAVAAAPALERPVQRVVGERIGHPLRVLQHLVHVRHQRLDLGAVQLPDGFPHRFQPSGILTDHRRHQRLRLGEHRPEPLQLVVEVLKSCPVEVVATDCSSRTSPSRRLPVCSDTPSFFPVLAGGWRVGEALTERTRIFRRPTFPALG